MIFFTAMITARGNNGLFYYGARYEVYPEHRIGDPKISVWLSVDPLAHEFPFWSPYNYTNNNILNLVDEDGMAPSYPYNHPVSRVIRGYNKWIYWALEGSSNTSTGHFHAHSRGSSGIDARWKAIGAIGEGIFASRQTSIPAYLLPNAIENISPEF